MVDPLTIEDAEMGMRALDMSNVYRAEREVGRPIFDIGSLLAI